ncbi:ABC transporter permease [Propionivibrio soli]|uniref:ABC transporter permease n=1 Tax=Propionivibrio soli TaxID=2976531 RepID=UPI0021E841E1
MSARWIRLRAQIIKELLCLLRDPRSRIVLIGPPIIQLFVFSFAITLEVKNIDVALLNHDVGGASVELVQQIESSDLVRRIRVAGSERELAELIDAQHVLAGIVIPETFSRDVAQGRNATAQIIIDGRKANAGQIALGYLQTIVGHVGATLRPTTMSGGGGDAAAVRHWFNPNLTYRWYVVPSLAGILVTLVALMVTALSIARERELGTFDQLLVSPCTPTEIIVAKGIPAFLVGIVLASVMIGAAVFLFGIPFTGSLGLLFVCLMLFILSLVGIGLMISSICSTQQQAILGTFAVVVPAVIMSGFATPVENMPLALQWIAECIPLKHFLIILQGSFLKALPPADVFANAWPMAVIAVVTLTLATLFVRSKLQ